MTIVNDLMTARGALDPWGRPDPVKVKEYQRLRAALNEEAKERWHDPEFHREVALMVASRLDYGFDFTNLFGTYFETTTVGEFETVELYERRGLKVFFTSRGGYIDESQLKTERWMLPRDTIGFHVSEHEDKLRANFADTIEAMVTLAEQRLDAEVNRRMFNLLQAAIPSSSPYYVNATTGVTKTNVDSAVTAVRDAIKPSNGTIPPVTILGRAAMIDAVINEITDAALMDDPALTDEVRRLGRIAVYRGANVVVIRNYTDENDLSYIPANELWVFGGTVGLFAFYGGMQTKQWNENTVDYVHYRGRRDIGGLVHHPEQARRIVDGTITP